MTRQTLIGIGIFVFVAVIAIGAVMITKPDQSDAVDNNAPRTAEIIAMDDGIAAQADAMIEPAAGEIVDNVVDNEATDEITETPASAIDSTESVEVIEAIDITDAADAADVVETKNTVQAVDYTDAESVQAHVMKVRMLGNPDAAVKLEEFASLTCNHCASFHTGAFKQLQSEYIDTDKIAFTYTDFPLNAPALDAAIVARCLPEERYFKFLSFLFETQEKWAFNAEYSQNLRQSAKLMGATDDMLDACLHNQDIRAALVARMQEAEKKYDVRSTPSFVVNDGAETLTGAQPFPAFKAMIEKHMATNIAQ